MAHDIPNDVTVQVVIRPANDRLQVTVRLPLKAIRDIEFPERDGGYLDFEKLNPLLPDAADVFVAEAIAM